MATNVLVQTVMTPKILFSGQLGSTADTTIATVPASSTWIVKSITAFNAASSATTLNINVVPNGQTSGVTRRIVQVLIDPQDTVMVDDIAEGLQLSAGDFFAAWASQASSINLLITGVEGS